MYIYIVLTPRYIYIYIYIYIYYVSMHIYRWKDTYGFMYRVSLASSAYIRRSKAFALTWYRSLTWYRVRWSPPRTHFEPWNAVGTHVGGLPCCPVTSCGSSGAANGRADEKCQVRARYQVRANPLLCTVSWPLHDFANTSSNIIYFEKKTDKSGENQTFRDLD